MIELISFAPFQPTPGLALWSLIIFLLFWFIMKKVAFKPIAEALKTRETDIQNALDEAKKARQEMANMQAENEKLILEAKQERATILKEAQDSKTRIITEAKDKAKSDAKNIMTSANVEIENKKLAAMTEVKNEVGLMALNIAEKVIKKELAGKPEHESFVNNLVKELNLN